MYPGTIMRQFWLSEIVLSIVILGIATDASADQGNAWKPARTRVFMAVLTEFQSARLHSFAQDERLDDQLVELFKKRGVPADQILLLKDRQATSHNVQTEFSEFLKKSGDGETLIFLFSSHGGYDPKRDKYSFYTYDDKLPFNWAFDSIERLFKGSQAILLADCCYSGGIVDLAAQRKTPIAFACLSSTYDHQTAWSGWRFIQCLNRGLAGDPVVDLDGNHQITLDELAGYTARYMSFVAEGKPMFRTTGHFDQGLLLSLSSSEKKPHVGELIETRSGHGWARAEIRDSRQNGFKVHFTKDTRSTADGWVAADAVRPYRYLTFPVGDTVDVEDSAGEWHAAKVLQCWESLHWCRNDKPVTVPDEWFGPSRIRPAIAGSWAGRFENDLDESGDETLDLQPGEHETMHGTWSGVTLNGERIGKSAFCFEAQTPRRFYRGAGRISGNQLVFDYCAHRTQGEHGKYYGWTSFLRHGDVTTIKQDPHAEFAGQWVGSYENSRSGNGVENLELTENAGELHGIWSQVAVKGERLGHATFYLTGNSGKKTYQVIGHVTDGQLTLDYSATEPNDQYYGWSTLQRKQP